MPIRTRVGLDTKTISKVMIFNIYKQWEEE